MPGPTNPYIYKPQDDPLTVANQFGTTPQALLQANPGGFPFQTGQTISIPVNPYQYSAPIGPQPPTLLQQRMAQPVTNRPPGAITINPQGGTGTTPYGPTLPPGTTPAPGTTYMLGRGGGQTAYLPQGLKYQRWTPGLEGGPASMPDPTKPYGGFTNNDPENTEYANTKAAQYYAANNTPWLNQTRWDPRRRKYISIRQWLGQNRRGGRGRGGGGRRRQQQAQDYTLSNSLIDFSVSAG